METLINIVLGVFLLLLLSGTLHIILYITGLWEIIKIKVNLPKPKKYLTKVDPIYELYRDEWGEFVTIRKWSLGYNNENTIWLQLIFLLIPYPIEFFSYGYHIEDSVVACRYGQEETITEDIGIIYERNWEIIYGKEIEEKRKKELIDNVYKTANKIFNENYN
jgi:hypothetical protein